MSAAVGQTKPEKKRGLLSGMRRLILRLSPDSLLARLILIFSAGFFALLLLTTIYAGESRHFYFMRGLMADRARRMAEVAVLLDATSPEIRFVLREQFNSRGFYVRFMSSRPVVAVHEDLKELSELMEYMLNVSLSRLYGDMPSKHGKMHGEGHLGSGSEEVPRRGVLVLRALNLPSPMESFGQSVCQYFTKDKNHLELLEAFARLARAEAWTLDLYGSGSPEWERRIRARVERLRLGGRVRFFGVTRTPRAILSRASICAYPSKVEGFGLALAEAMWCGLPCVGFADAPGVNGLLTHEANGLLAEPGPEAFARQLQRLIDDPGLRTRLGACAARTVRQAYAAPHIWQQWEDLVARHLTQAPVDGAQ